MKRLLIMATLVFFSAISVAEVDPEWIRYPAISPDGQTIAFTYKGDIYAVPAQGGQATRLTFHKAHDYSPVWSHDGKQIAFASDRFGHFDVFVMDSRGGQATRLTFHSTNEQPYAFSADNTQVIFSGQRMDLATHRQYPSGRLPELYQVPVTGGRVEQIFTVPADDVQVSLDGKTLIYHDQKGAENPWRKKHKSSATRDIWRYDMVSKEHKQITTFAGEDRNPVFAKDNNILFYLSEESGSFNVHRLDMNRPSRNTQLTHFTLHPVRFLSHGNGTLAFSYHGKLYTIPESGQPQQVKVSIRTQDVDNNQEMLPVNAKISEMVLSPNGKEIAFVAHGDVFVSSVDGAFTKQITHTASREGFVSFSAEGDYLLYGGERDGRWSIYKATKVRSEEPFFYAATLINETPLISNDKDNYQPQMSPDGKKLAYVEDRRTLKVMDLSSGNSVTLLTPDSAIHFSDGDKTFSWSPDSQWILFEYRKWLHNSDVAMINANGGEPMRVLIPSGYNDVSPKWANAGKQILWFSNRDGLRSYATSGRAEFDVYTLFFTQGAWDEFRLSEDDFKLMQAIKEAAKAKESDDKAKDDKDKEDKKSKDKTVAPIALEWDRLDERVAKLTIHSSQLADAVLNKAGDTLYYLSRFEDKHDLWMTNLRTKETKKAITLGVRGGALQWDPAMETLYLLAEGSMSKLDLAAGKREGISIKATTQIDYDAVRQYAFEHVWLRNAKVFYEPSYHAVDWALMHTEYQPKVAHVSNEWEFTELLSEMLGELNVSHSGASYRPNNSKGDATAALGVFYDYSHQGVGIKITEVIAGGPLDRAAFNVTTGMVIEKIDGEPVATDIDWAALLNRKAGTFVLLYIRNLQGETKQLVVKPITLAQQQALLYQRFVKINEQDVLKRSNGQLGYVHIPGMADGPYRDVYNDMMGRFSDKKAMVIDTRFNGGGDLVADLAMFFTGKPFLTYATADRVVGGEPTSRYTKPIITLFNEAMYSDGHCYASAFKDLKLGKSVGMPVPGTCSFAGWEALPLGGRWGTVPVSAKNMAGEWLENNQTPPDIMIQNQPGIIDFGRDQQLERAVQELMKQLR
ncbi:S41 family peptidase [Arsukibacterium sp.]|uniref:S41 family peptidase n=1 Tax=Arsukibacterium sp. TaxID=1977258 RepID=UPI002FDB8608